MIRGKGYWPWVCRFKLWDYVYLQQITPTTLDLTASCVILCVWKVLPSIVLLLKGRNGHTHYYKSWNFQLETLTKKYPYRTLVKKTTQSFWSSCFWHDQFDWWSFWLVKWWTIWLVKLANKKFGQHFFWSIF